MTIEKVLLVDDEPDIRQIGTLSLSHVGGWQAITASSGAEAVTVAGDEMPDLILLDVVMPGMDGPATLKALRENPSLANTPIIFLTARANPDEVALYKGLGAVGVIQKPFDPMGLPASVRGLLGD